MSGDNNWKGDKAALVSVYPLRGAGHLVEFTVRLELASYLGRDEAEESRATGALRFYLDCICETTRNKH